MVKQVLQLKIEFLQLFYTKGVWSVVLTIIFLLGLLYLILPGPSSIDEFPQLPQSTKSQLEGDTIQNPNISAYFSNAVREDIVPFYWNFFSNYQFGFIKLPLFKINHPPEFAYNYIRDQQESTGLEEYFRPLRESLFVNVYDAFIYSQIRNTTLSFETTHLEYYGDYFASKTTLRYYPSNIWIRIVVYLLIFKMIFLMYKLSKYYLKSYR